MSSHGGSWRQEQSCAHSVNISVRTRYTVLIPGLKLHHGAQPGAATSAAGRTGGGDHYSRQMPTPDFLDCSQSNCNAPVWSKSQHKYQASIALDHPRSASIKAHSQRTQVMKTSSRRCDCMRCEAVSKRHTAPPGSCNSRIQRGQSYVMPGNPLPDTWSQQPQATHISSTEHGPLAASN